VIDLVRFGVSLQLAADENGWASEATSFFDTFLEGYRDAIRDPEFANCSPQNKGASTSSPGALSEEDRVLEKKGGPKPSACFRPEPQVVERLRRNCSRTRTEFLAWANSAMTPFPLSRPMFDQAWKRYEEMMLDEFKDLPDHFFSIKKLGGLHLG